MTTISKTVAGSYTFNIPIGVPTADSITIISGGGGGGDPGALTGGGGGGGGGYTTAANFAWTAGADNIVVGAGGGVGNGGSPSMFAGLTGVSGGSPGTTTGGAGGGATGGDSPFAGGNGGNGGISNDGGGGGGAAGGANGQDATTAGLGIAFGGNGANTGGNGGTGGVSDGISATTSTATVGTPPGGGGGGASFAGGDAAAGADGRIDIIWTPPTPIPTGLTVGGGLLSGGTTVHINGSQFSSLSTALSSQKVTIDGVDCPVVSVNSDMDIGIITPTGSSVGNKTMLVFTEGSTPGSAGTGVAVPGGFTYFSTSTSGGFIICG